MVARAKLTSFLASELQPELFKDYCPNGLQIEGKGEISRVVTGVTATQRLIEEAVSWQADAVLVHHGFFWQGESQVLTGYKRARIQALLTHDINLYAYHLPLDCHKTLGNNACIAQQLTLEKVNSVAVSGVPNLLWYGHLNKPLSAKELASRLSTIFGQQALHLRAQHDKLIDKVAWCSGAAQRYIEEASRLGADAYISGEASEQTTHLAHELDIDYFACGHHATERFGAQALGNYLERELGISHRFIDIPNPV